MIDILGNIMHICYRLFNSYGIGIIIFTLLSKIILLPVSLWIQKNSIKTVNLQIKINKLKVKYFGDKDKIADETAILYRNEKYNPLLSLIPLTIQMLILIGLIMVINKPLTYINKIDKNIIKEMNNITLKNNKSINKESSNIEIYTLKEIKSNSNNYLKLKDKYPNIDKDIESIKNTNYSFLNIDLTGIAINDKGLLLIMPFLAGLSALLLSLSQNRFNPLQSTQGLSTKISTAIFSIGLSLYLGFFVVIGVVIYWIASNLLSIIQQFILNIIINPKKSINYDELNNSKKELDELNNINKHKMTHEEKIKEKQDYKRFFSIANKHLVFYSESNGFYKYYKSIIEYLLDNTKVTIHYITSDYNDNIFNMEKDNPSRIKAYYISNRKLITLMMKMDADVVVMTMPDLENFHIKRSYVRKDIEYIYIPHGMNSLNMCQRKGSMDHYDTVFACGKHQKEEFEKGNIVYNIPNRKILEWGYSLLDDMILDYNKSKKNNKDTTILIAPSWQQDNIIDLCLENILDKLKDNNYKLIVRPHPEHVKHEPGKFEELKNKYSNNKNIIIQTDFTSNDTVFNADLLITDWSGVAFEYAFTTLKPVLFIDTPMKVMNKDYKEIDVEPFNIWVRDRIGVIKDPKNLKDIDKTVKELLSSKNKYKKEIDKVLHEYFYNIGTSAEVGSRYIIECIQKKIEDKNK